MRGRNFSEIWVDVDEPHSQVMTSSQMAEQSGKKAVPTLFGIPGQIIPPYDQRNAVNDDADIPSQTQETEGTAGDCKFSLQNCLAVLKKRLRISYRLTWNGWELIYDPNRRIKAREKVWLGMYPIPSQKPLSFPS